MKSLITALSVLTLGTTIGNLSSNLNTNQKIETISNNVNQDIKKVNNIDFSNIATKNNLTTIKGGENYYNWYFLYHVIGLSHKTLNDVNNALDGGIGAVSAILAVSNITNNCTMILLRNSWLW